MPDQILVIVVAASFVAVLAGVRYFRTLDPHFGSAARTPLLAGLVTGGIVALTGTEPLLEPVLIGILLTIAAVYVRMTGDESEPVDGMMLGALSGAAAALPLAIRGSAPLHSLAASLLAGSISGCGITLAWFYVNARLRQLALDLATAALGAGAAILPFILGVPPRELTLGIAAAIPLAGIATVFVQWRDIRAELSHEASLGFIAAADVRPTAHPFRRLGRGGWVDAAAHREFVRLATSIAHRKRQQRHRSEEIARLYQIEIIKLRMQIQQMVAVDRASQKGALGQAGEMMDAGVE
ncbi:MAG TPA: hypothetical protein VEZ11_15710 [Thermoanaerobaculia bacterium]|nr:hypothetical protein [Thermoanaerobaculia bacterium]